LIVVVLIVAVLLAAPFFIDVNAYKSQIEKAVEDQTGRQLSIGNIDASLLPWVGVELNDVHLANRSGFAKRDFLSVERLHVKLAVLPLLSKKIEIKHFEVVSPVIYLERRNSGESNWGDLIASSATDGSADSQSQSTHQAVQTRAPAAPALAALQAESLSLTGGQVTWVDADAAPVVLSELNVALDDVQLQRPVALRVSGKLSGSAFELNAHVGPVGDLATLNVLALPLQGHFKAENIQLQPFQHVIGAWPEQLGDIASASVQLSVQIEQHPNGVRLGEGEMHLKAAHALALGWKVEMPNADQMKINYATLTVNGKGLIDAKGNVEHLSSKPRFAVRLDGHVIERTWLEAFVPGLHAMYSAHPAPWKQLQFSALLEGGAKQLDINDLQLKLDNDLLKTSGTVSYAGPDIRLRMAANQLHLDAWLPQGKEADKNDQSALKGWSIMAEAIAATDVKGEAAEPNLRFLRNWRIGSQLKVKTLFVRGMQMGDFSAAIHGANGYIKLSPMQFKLAGGKVTEKASLNVNAYPVKWKESVHIAGVQAGPLLKALAEVDMLEGSMDMDTKFQATGLTPSAVSTLNGRGTVLFKDGKLKGFDIAGAIRKFTNPAAFQQGPQETDFAKLSGTFDVKNGIAHNRDLFMASPLLRITGQGTIDLVQKRMDYEVKPRVVGSLKGQGDTFMRKGLSIPLHIYGPFEAPKITPIISAKTLIQNAPALLNKGGLNIGGKLGNILGGGKQAAPQGEAQPQAEPQPEPPQKQLLKGLGGLIPGF